MIETIKLSKSYKGKKVVDDVDIYIDEGESIGLLGPNGAMLPVPPLSFQNS